MTRHPGPAQPSTWNTLLDLASVVSMGIYQELRPGAPVERLHRLISSEIVRAIGLTMEHVPSVINCECMPSMRRRFWKKTFGAEAIVVEVVPVERATGHFTKIDRLCGVSSATQSAPRGPARATAPRSTRAEVAQARCGLAQPDREYSNQR